LRCNFINSFNEGISAITRRGVSDDIVVVEADAAGEVAEIFLSAWCTIEDEKILLLCPATKTAQRPRCLGPAVPSAFEPPPLDAESAAAVTDLRCVHQR
jgi:hypothetical protein